MQKVEDYFGKKNLSYSYLHPASVVLEYTQNNGAELKTVPYDDCQGVFQQMLLDELDTQER